MRLMSTLILATKLYIPPPPPQAVLRPRLLERLDAGLHRKLTLISAPAGFGKTTLISAWAAGRSAPVAWLSLEEADGDPVRFLTYLVAALQMLAPQVGQGVLGALQSQPPPPTEAVLTVLLNELATIPGKFVLVLDDYHAIDAPAVDLALAFLLEHLPPALHLVITTREDPALPLPRLRARGQLTELRAADLRFTPVEAAEFLNQVMGLQLATDEIAALETRTEGWIAGLQLAALSVQGQPDVAHFVQSFAGSHRFVLDYLAEEVLQRQPSSVQDFLLHTSILDRLCGPLCDAVTGQAGGSARLEALTRGNFFVVPLDDQRQWYRYHHLFGGVLQARLLADQPDLMAALHERASAWYAANGLPDLAIRHALAAADFARAAYLIELAVPELRRNRQEGTLLGWLKMLPGELLRRRPVLSVAYAYALLATGMLDGVESRLRDAERWLGAPAYTVDAADRTDTEGAAGIVVVDRAEFSLLPGMIAAFRAAHALARGDIAGTERSARRALELVSAQDHLWHGAAAALLGLASWTKGELRTAERSYAASLASMQQIGHISDALGCALALADIKLAQGCLYAAMRACDGALQLALAQGASGLRGTADMHVGMSEIYCEHNDLNAAEQHLAKSRELGDLAGLPQNPYRWRAAMARLRQANGDLDGALDLLQEAERLYTGDFSPNVHPIAARVTRVWIAQGRLSEALSWAHAAGLSFHDNLSYLREFEHITLARVLLARCGREEPGGSLLETLQFLARLLQAAEAGGRVGSAIEILLLQALAYQMGGDSAAALSSLGRSLALAEPEGYVRLFVEEGRPLARLLRELAARGIMPAYAGRLLAALDMEQPANADQLPPQPHGDRLQSHNVRSGQGADPLVEPLSQRELEVLRLFNSELSGPEIARELVVALSTVRTHTKSIYSKLSVNSRRAAVKRAADLHLL